MDQVYQAKLSGSPPGQNQSSNQNQQVDNNGNIHIQSMPNLHPYPASATANEAARGQPIPVQLPNIYVTAPSPAPAQPVPSRREHRPHTQEVRMMHFGPFRFARPHPLLWITLGLSLIALVLEVPKGSLPTLTGRHKQLRTQEKLVQERLHLLTRLSTFLPPPLAHIIDPQTPSTQRQGHLPHNLDLLKFWNSNVNTYPMNGMGVGGGDRWWSIEELGEGASVVRSKTGVHGNGVDREVWVLRVGSDDHSGNQQPLLNALTHSLLLRDQQAAEITSLKAQSLSLTPHPQAQAPAQISHKSHHQDDGEEEEVNHRSQERERKRKEREREKMLEMEEREQEVGRRERWVIEEMRKLTDKVHAEASELTLEDRITERLKSYQRQLTKMTEERERDVMN